MWGHSKTIDWSKLRKKATQLEKRIRKEGRVGASQLGRQTVAKVSLSFDPERDLFVEFTPLPLTFGDVAEIHREGDQYKVIVVEALKQHPDCYEMLNKSILPAAIVCVLMDSLSRAALGILSDSGFDSSLIFDYSGHVVDSGNMREAHHFIQRRLPENGLPIPRGIEDHVLLGHVRDLVL